MGRSLRVRAAMTGAAVIALGLSVVGPASAETVTVIASGLDNPRGIDVGANGRVYVAEAGAGRIAVIAGGKVRTLVGGLPSLTSPEGETTGVVNVDAHGTGNIVAVVGGGPKDVDRRFDTALRVNPSGIKRVLDIQAYRNAHPQPTCDPQGNPVAWCDLDQPPFATDSNAYGVAGLNGNRMLVTDAAGNDLILVSGGKAVTVAKFPNHLVGTAHLPPFLQIPPDIQLPAEPVPTSVTVGPDGYWYVGELTGFPFTPGASRVWRVAPWARGVTCDEANPTRACAVYATGFTSIIDLDFGPDGALYVAEMVKGGVGNLFFGSDDLAGAVWRLKGGSRTELAPGQLVLVGGIAAVKGAVYATTFDVTPDDGQVVRISG